MHKTITGSVTNGLEAASRLMMCQVFHSCRSQWPRLLGRFSSSIESCFSIVDIFRNPPPRRWNIPGRLPPNRRQDCSIDPPVPGHLASKCLARRHSLRRRRLDILLVSASVTQRAATRRPGNDWHSTKPAPRRAARYQWRVINTRRPQLFQDKNKNNCYLF